VNQISGAEAMDRRGNHSSQQYNRLSPDYTAGSAVPKMEAGKARAATGAKRNETGVLSETSYAARVFPHLPALESASG
jgi:hypothetical protein